MARIPRCGPQLDVFPEARRYSVTVRTRGRLTPQTSRACESGCSSDRRRDEHIGRDAPTSEVPGSMPVPFSQKTYIPVRTNEQSYSYAIIVAMWRWVLVSGAKGTGPPTVCEVFACNARDALGASRRKLSGGYHHVA